MNDAGAIATRAALIDALTDAAELEQAVICQYLFAAYSLKCHPSEPGVDDVLLESLREWKAQILSVARSEMEHLGLVCNLLSAVGGAPHFFCPNFPAPARGAPAGCWFQLQPFSPATLQRFIEFERLHGEPGDGFQSIYDLYQSIRDGLVTLAARGTPLFVGDRQAQVTSQHIDLAPGWHDILLLPVDDLTSALHVIDRILETGHAPDSAGGAAEAGRGKQTAERWRSLSDFTGENSLGSDESVGGPSHHDRFVQTLSELNEILQRHPEFAPARPVVGNPITRAASTEQNSTGPAPGSTPITQPVTLQATRLFNAAYRTMLQLLQRFYAPGDESMSQRLTLGRLAMFPLMTVVIRPLAELLTMMPASDGPVLGNAGPTFQLNRAVATPSPRRSAMFVLHEALVELVELSDRLQNDLARSAAAWALPLIPRFRFVHENLQSLAIRFEHSTNIRAEHAELNFRKLCDL